MGKIQFSVTHNLSSNIHQQPKVQKENKPSKVQPPPPKTQAQKVNVKAAEKVPFKNDLAANLLRLKLEKKLDASIASKPKKTEVKVTYTPIDKRHEISKYDKLPSFANRTTGFDDRYRAVNPKRVAAGGDQAFYFPIKKGSLLLDGNGNERGVIKWSKVQLNYGQVKIINNEKHYYAFATEITDKNSNKKISASGWIKESAIENGNQPKFTQEAVNSAKPKPVAEKPHGEYKDYQQYVVKNVSPAELTGADGKPKYGYMENGKFISYKVLPGKTKDENFAASDYLRREGNVINLGFNAAGVSNDTFKTDGANPVVFHRAPTSVKSATVDIDLYHPKDKNHAGQKPVGKMRFVYGYVETQGQKRWGWMALGALEQKK